jgi:hypothetical protein
VHIFENFGGHSGDCAEVMLSRLANTQKHSIHGTEFCCEDVTKTVEAIENFLTLVDEGTTG